MASPNADAEIYDVLSTLLLSGRLPGNVDEDRYLEAWVDQTVSVLAQHTNHRNR